MDVAANQAALPQVERWLSVEEIAEHLGVSRDSIYRWAEHRKMPAHKVGRKWKFWVNEVNEWVRAGQAEKLNSLNHREQMK